MSQSTSQDTEIPRGLDISSLEDAALLIRDINLSSRPIDAIRATLRALRAMCGVHSASFELASTACDKSILIALDRDNTCDLINVDLYKVAYPLDVRFPAWRSSSIVIEQSAKQLGENVQKAASLLRILGAALDRYYDNSDSRSVRASPPVEDFDQCLESLACDHDAIEAIVDWYHSTFASSFAIVLISELSESQEAIGFNGTSYRACSNASSDSVSLERVLDMPAEAPSLMVADRGIDAGTSLQIVLGSDIASAWSESDHSLFQAATTISVRHLARLMRRQPINLNTHFLSDMQEITTAASSATNLDELCQIVHQTTLRFIPLDRIRVQLDLHDQGMKTIYERGYQLETANHGDSRTASGLSSMATPLLADGSPIGFIEVESDEHAAFTDEQAGILNAIAQGTTGAFERQLLLDRIALQTRYESGLRLIAERINATLDVGELIQIASSAIFDTVPSSMVVVSVVDRASGTVRLRSYRSDDPEFAPPAIGYRLRKESITFHAIQAMEQQVVDDGDDSPYSTFRTPLWKDFGSAVATPIAISDELAGVIVVAWRETHGFTKSDLSLQRQAAAMLGASLESAFAYEKQLRHARDLSGLRHLTSRIASQLDLQDGLDEIANAAANLVEADGCAVAMIDDTTLEVMSAIGVAAGNLPPRFSMDLELVARIIEETGFVAFNDLAEGADGLKLTSETIAGSRAILAVRLDGPDGKPAGIIGVFSVEPRVWTDRDISLLTTLSSASAVAIRNARHFENTRDLLRASVESLATAVDAKDPGAQNHARQVARFARMIAEELGIGPDRVGEIELAALLHDVGKIGIPDSVLEKPGPLDSAEWAAIQLHPAIGEQILSGNPAIEALLPMVRHHHERWDGNGYPDRLGGDEIPAGAAIIAVAEALDAMTAHRPYQAAKSWSQAVAEIRSNSGNQFAPFVVDALTKLHWHGAFTSDEKRVACSAHDMSDWDRQRFPSLDVRALRIMEAVATEIRAGAGLEMFLGNIARLLRSTLDVPYLTIFVRDLESDTLKLIASDPVTALEDGAEERVMRGKGLVNWVARHGITQNIGDVTADERCIQGIKGVDIRSELCVPLVADGQTIGVMNFESYEPDAFSEADERLLMSTADHIANAINVVRLHERLKVLSTTDALTGLANHRSFFEQLVEEAALADAHQRDLSVVILDVNNLKDLNDSYGHLVGDAALRAVASVLSRHCRSGDVACRYGGDEFAMILPSTSSAEAWQLIEDLALDLMDGEFEAEGVTMPLPTSSFGIATAPQDGTRPIELLAAADERMYVQKTGQRT